MQKRVSLNSGICAVLSTLSSVVSIPGYDRLSDHPLLSGFVKCVFNRHLPLCKYYNIWEINDVMSYYDKLVSNTELKLNSLTDFRPMFPFYTTWKRQKTSGFQEVKKGNIGLKWVKYESGSPTPYSCSKEKRDSTYEYISRRYNPVRWQWCFTSK